MPRNSKASRLSRRRLLQMGTAGLSAATLAKGSTVEAGPIDSIAWRNSFDIVICGSGAAGSAAALFAAKAGKRVALFEKSAAWGGTAARSGFHLWIPNHEELKSAGLEDNKRECLEYMVQYSYPHRFDPQHPTLGIATNTYELLEAFYEHAADTIEKITDWSDVDFRTATLGVEQTKSPDYFEHSPWNKVPQGRALAPCDQQGNYLPSSRVVGNLRQALVENGVHIYMQHRAGPLLRNATNEVIGLQVVDKNGNAHNIRARQGVIFCTGCYSHNRQYLESFQRTPVFGSCGIATNEGDFIAIAGDVGAQMGNLSGAWRAQVVLEETIQYQAVQAAVYWPPGDSMIVVNRYGERFGNEKRNYNDRAKMLYNYDANRCEYPNLINIMIYDQRTADLNAGHHPIPPANLGMDFVITGDTMAELSNAIDLRLRKLSKHTGGVMLAEGFREQISATVARFNRMAERGKDDDFGRGSYLYDNAWHQIRPISDHPRWPTDTATKNTTMYPLQAKGPYYAIILCPGILGTNGGPVVDKNGQVLDYFNKPINGLYAAGNCMAHPAADGYWGAGATIGTAMTFARIAAESAANSAVSRTTS